MTMLKSPTPETGAKSYYRDSVIEAVDQLVINHELHRLSGIFADFVYFLSHSDRIEDGIDKQSITEHATECINLLGNLANVYEYYREFKNR